MKRGQVTVFIILSILIVFFGVLIFLLISNKNRSDFEQTFENLEFISEEARQVYSFVSDCIDKSVDSVLYGIGKHGGRFLVLPNSYGLDTNYIHTTSDGVKPSLNELEDEISSYLKTEIFLCTAGFIDFTQLNITAGKIKSQINFEDNYTIFKINYPINLRESSTSSSFSEFNLKKGVRMKLLYDFSTQIVQDFENNGDGSICINCILDQSLRNNLFVDTINLDEKNILVVIRDPIYLIDNQSYEFKFLMRANEI